MPPNRLLPDTCAWIDFFRGRQTPLAAAIEQALLQGEVSVCGIVLFELLQGIKNPKEETLVQNAFQALPHLEMSRALWIKAGKLSSRLRASGPLSSTAGVGAFPMGGGLARCEPPALPCTTGVAA